MTRGIAWRAERRKPPGKFVAPAGLATLAGDSAD
jgi:hypothetical protein